MRVRAYINLVNGETIYTRSSIEYLYDRFHINEASICVWEELLPFPEEAYGKSTNIAPLIRFKYNEAIKYERF